MLVFQLLWLQIGDRNGTCCMKTMLPWTFTNNMTWFSTIQTKIVCMSTLFILFHEGLESCLINMHGVLLWWGCQGLVNIIGGKTLCVVGVGSWSLSCQCSRNLLSHQTTYARPDLMLKGLAWRITSLSHHFITQIKIDL
jgi:hypothetical protein